VEHKPYGDVTLTEEGWRLAARTERSRDVLTQFFTDILGLPSETAAEDACMIEHLVSPSSMMQLLRLTAFLRSDDPAAARLREAFRAYQARCDAGDVGDPCPVCTGTCVRHTFDEAELPEGPLPGGPLP
jgi:Mn-dependent DtxR family transcriptional regulator